MKSFEKVHALRHVLCCGLSLMVLSSFVFVLVLSPRAAFGDVNARIQGTITDPSGAVIPGVTVTVTNVATGVSRKVTSSNDGSFAALNLLAPGVYNVTAGKSGFKKFSAQQIHLSVSQVYVLRIQMEIGSVTQEVTVRVAPTQVQTTSMQLGASITGSALVNLPLNGRNWIQLQQTLPGVVAAADGRGNYATNGSQPGQNSYLINGIDTNDFPLNTPLVIPSPDAIAEVRMITSTINPEYGRNSGAIMNAATKSGTNQFHGDAFDFFRDTSLNARNFFHPRSDIFHRHQFGGTIGGPIVKDHAFFFFSYQGSRARRPQGGGSTTVFTPDQRNGIWGAGATDCYINTSGGETPGDCPTSPYPMVGDSASACASGTALCPAGTRYGSVYDVASGTPVLIASAGPGLWSTGTIPSANFNPLALSLMNKFVPLPNSGTEFDFNPIHQEVVDQYFTRIDENISSKDELAGSWLWERHPVLDTLPFDGANLPGFPADNREHIQNYSLTWTHVFSGTTLNEARIGYTRMNYNAVAPVNIVDPSSVGFTGINPQQPSNASYPVISVLGYFDLGFSTDGPQPRIDQTYQVDDNFTKIAGRHTFKMGFDMRRFQIFNAFASSLSGAYDFGGSGVYTTGAPGVDFLLGIPDSFDQGGGDVMNDRGQEYYLYFQDQWKARRNLTLTFGTGWQIDTPTVDNYHNNHAMTAFYPGKQSTVFPNAPTGYLFQGDPGVNATGTTKYNHFGPRFGFAWSPGTSARWSVRGGYGIYFNRELAEQLLQYVNQAPWSPYSTGATDCGGSPSFANPYVDIATGTPCNNPFPASLSPPSNVDFGPYLPTWLYAVSPDHTVPYSQNFNLTVQHQLTDTSIISVGYVGALGRKEVILVDANPGVNPAGCLSGVGAEAGCVKYRIYQNYYYPQNYNYGYDPRYGVAVFGVGYNQTTGISNYNALQVTFNKHMSHGLSFDAVYTWSHALDNGSGFENSGFGGGGFGAYGDTRATNPFNQTLYNYGSSSFDAKQRFVIAYTYLIPPIHRFSNGAAKRFFDGWKMTGITTFQSGFPLDVVDSSFRSLTCSALSWTVCWDVPNEVSTPQYVDPRTSSFNNNNLYWFNPSAFAQTPTFGVQGNAGRNPLRGPGIANFDWAFMKETQITESTRLELRFEFYNLFNHTQFDSSGITTDINSSNFGRILAARDPRLIQLAAKFYF